jgi:hypothetical protein
VNARQHRLTWHAESRKDKAEQDAVQAKEDEIIKLKTEASRQLPLVRICSLFLNFILYLDGGAHFGRW